ncbi:MAG TPA: hypothetical protein GX708_22360 [Gallicola sp.]|nr:hypothetical protein [Gallicola sp.]
MEIKEGMYFRTNTGIRRVVYINDGCITFDDFMSNGTSLFNFIEEKELDMYLTKEPSYRIIDLIEVGDYVNGYKVLIKNSECGRPILVYGINTNDKQIAITIYEEDIKTIVTKEQFESMKYSLEG